MSRNNKLAIALIILVIAILGAIVFATGHKDNKQAAKHDTNKVAKVENKTESKPTETQGQVEGASTTADEQTATTPTTSTPTQTKTTTHATVTTASAPVVPSTSTNNNTQTQTPPAQTTPSNNDNNTTTPPTNNDTPVVPVTPGSNDNTPTNPGDNNGSTPTEPKSCFVHDENTVYVPAGGNSESYTLTTDTPSLWWSYAENVDTSDAGTNVKPAFPVFIVIEDENFNPMTATTSITFHFHAREDATVGDLCPQADEEALGFVATDPETLTPVDSIFFNVSVVEAQPAVL